MLIHSYLTNGFIEFGKILLISFKKHHGEDIPIFFTTRDLTNKEINDLKSLYSNLIISNKPIDYEYFMKATNLDKKTTLLYKQQIEKEKVYHMERTNVKWKQFISVEDRYRNSIVEAMNFTNKNDTILHLDVDSFIKNPMFPIFDVIKEHDVSLMLTLHRNRHTRKLFGGVIGITVNDNAFRFMEKWREYIDRIPLNKKPIGYGQSSCFYAFMELQNTEIDWGKIDYTYLDASSSKEDAIIWAGNHPRGKIKTTELFKGLLND